MNDYANTGQITVGEAAKRLGVRQNYIRVLLSEGLITGTKIGNRWAIAAAGVDEYKNRKLRPWKE